MVSVETMGGQIDFVTNYIAESTSYFSLLIVNNYLQFHFFQFLLIWKFGVEKICSPNLGILRPIANFTHTAEDLLYFNK